MSDRLQEYRGVHGMADACIHSVVDNLVLRAYIVETSDWMNRFLRLLSHLDVFFVGVQCSLSEFERGERGDRRIGEAKMDYERTHTFDMYDRFSGRQRRGTADMNVGKGSKWPVGSDYLPPYNAPPAVYSLSAN